MRKGKKVKVFSFFSEERGERNFGKIYCQKHLRTHTKEKKEGGEEIREEETK